MKRWYRAVCIAVPLFSLVLVGILQRLHGQEASPRVSRLSYRLSCSLMGQPVACSASCMACAPHAIDKFEILNSAGKAQVSVSAPVGRTFTFVEESETKARLHTIEQVRTSEAQPISQTGNRLLPESYFFESTSAGLVPLVPPLTSPCGDGIAFSSGGPEPLCDFDYGYFRFSVQLSIDFDNHHIKFAPDQTFNVFPLHRKQTPWRVARPSAFNLYAAHRNDSPYSVIRLRTGDTAAFWQTDADVLRRRMDAIAVLSMWAPMSMKPVLGASGGGETVDYDRRNVWLQVRAGRKTGWIYGDRSFHAIGLIRQN